MRIDLVGVDLVRIDLVGAPRLSDVNAPQSFTVEGYRFAPLGYRTRNSFFPPSPGTSSSLAAFLRRNRSKNTG